MLPKTEEFLNQVEEDLPDSYIEKLESSANYISSGIAAVATYIEGGGLRKSGEAYRAGSLLGVNTRIVDDLMDGDGVEKVESREEFLDNYIASIEGEEVQPVEHESEEAAYTAGKLLGENLDRDIMASYVRDVRDIAVEEKKSTSEGYRSYSRGISASIGEMVAMGLEELEDFEADTETINFAYDLAYLGQMADDRMDGDTGLEDDELEEFFQESVSRMRRHGLKGRFIAEVASAYPAIYTAMKKVSETASSE